MCYFLQNVINILCSSSENSRNIQASFQLCINVNIIGEPLQDNRPFAKFFQNMIGAPKVMLAKKLIPNLKNVCSRNGIFVV